MNRHPILGFACSLLVLTAGAVSATEPPAPTLDPTEVAGAPVAGGEELPEVGLAPPQPVPAAKECPPEGCDPEPSPFSCSESDSGNAPYTTGTLWFFYYGNIIGVHTDTCATPGRLTEYHCNTPNSWAETNWFCNCSGGRCV